MKRIWKDYFTFSKKERVAVAILLLLIASFIAAPYFYSVTPKPPVLNKALSDFVANSKVAQLPQDSMAETGETFIGSPGKKVTTTFSLFPFDPNTISVEEWKRLGVNDKTIRTILNYRSKGGSFRTPEDIRKIWGMKKDDADRIIPYVQIAETELHPFNKEKNNSQNRQPVTGNRKPTIIDINTATIEDWKVLPGIGDALANRIVNYRERMGGFTNESQVKKTYGISDSVFQLIAPYLKTDPTSIPRLDLNTASAYDLKMRTNIPDAIAKAIVVYHQQYGPYAAVSDLKKIVFLNDSLFQQIARFVKVN